MGDCGGCQVMSKPLVLHGTQISLPKHRPPLNPNPSLPCIPEGTAELLQPGDASTASSGTHTLPEEGEAKVSGSQAQVTGPQAKSTGPQVVSAYQPHTERRPAPLRSSLSTSMPLGGACQPARSAAKAALAAKEGEGSKDRTLDADERLKRLKVRMQHTIQAYSGSVSSSAASAGKYSRTQSLTAASQHSAYHRTNSIPVRAARVNTCAVIQSTSDETSSCYSSSSSTAAIPASMDGGAEGAAQGGAQGGFTGKSPDEQLLRVRSCVPTQTYRGIHQVAFQ